MGTGHDSDPRGVVMKSADESESESNTRLCWAVPIDPNEGREGPDTEMVSSPVF